MQNKSDISRTRLNAKLLERLIPVLVGLLTVAAFLPVLQNGFVDWDDDLNIVDNQNYRGVGWKQLRWMFTNLDMGHYQPLSWLTLGVDYVLWGLNPFGYHLTSLLLHGIAAIIFYFVALRLLSAAFPRSSDSEEAIFRMAAAFAALLFSIHPLRVESVAWATERRGVLAGLFFQLSIFCYLRANAVQDANIARTRWMIASFVTFALSLLSKAAGLALPIVLLTLDVYPLERLRGGVKKWLARENRKVWREKIPFLLLTLAAAILALLAEQARGALRDLQHYSIMSRANQIFFGMVFYIWKTLVPTGLFPMYEKVADAIPAYWWVRPPEEMIKSASIVIALAMTLVLIRLRRRWPAGLSCWVCYLALLAPVLGFVRIGGHIAADRYTYLACLGGAVLAGGGVVYFSRFATDGHVRFRRLVAAAMLPAAVVAGLAALTWRQSQAWRDSDTLFKHALEVAPYSRLANVQLGFVLADRGELDEAVKLFHRALRDNPDDPVAHYDLADTLWRQGKLDEAAQHYFHVIRLNPKLAIAHQRVGNVLAEQGRLAEAAGSFHRAVQINPDFGVAHNNLGLLLASQGKLDEAIEHYRKALDLNPDFALAHVNYGDALLLRGRVDEAVKHFQKALDLEPEMAAAHYSLGRGLAQKGRLAEAIAQFREALKGDEKFASAYFELGEAYFKAGRYREAVAQYRRAVEINPTQAVAYFNMGNALLKSGDATGAIEQYRLAIKYDKRYAEAYLNLGNALEVQGETEEAMRQYRRSIEVNPEDAGGHYNLGNALLKKREVGQAIEEYRRAIKINPRYVEAWSNLGSALDMGGKKEEAIEQYREALKIDSGYGAARFNLGLLLKDRGDMAGAMEQFRKVIEINAGDAEAHFQLGSVLAAAGKVEEAAGEFRHALRIEPGFAPARQGLERLGAP